MQAVQLKREIGDCQGALALVDEGLAKYRGDFKLWLIKAQVQAQLGLIEEARKTYDEAL